MGYVLFTSSGTFKPADYGLAPGDTIQITAIGGGAGGAGGGADGSYGSAGSASSFGSILTAPGGTACKDGNTSGALSEGMLPGTDIGITYDPSNNDRIYGVGGQGGPGWMPGEAREYFELLCQLTYNTNGGIVDGAIFWQKAAPSLKQRAASVVPFGASSTDTASNNRNYYHYQGVGGRGYGAGGGGVVDGIGGNSGALRHASYKLPNTNNIAVTVGNGGTGGYWRNTENYAGGGARGCVAVFW